MCRASVTVMAVPDDHDPVMMMTMPAMIAMHFSPRVETVVIVSDHHSLRTCNRRRGNGNRTKCGNNVSKLLHDVLLVCAGDQHCVARNVPGETEENSEQAFIYAR